MQKCVQTFQNSFLEKAEKAMAPLLIKMMDGTLLELVQVPGDGNCFFHAVALSESVNISEHQELRNFLVGRVSSILTNPSDHGDVIMLFQHASGSTKLIKWLDIMKKTNTWGDDRVALFVEYFFQVNIHIVSNTKGGFYHYDIRLWSQLHGYRVIPNDAPTMYLYHYLFERPTTPSKNCNHFGFLRKVDLQTGQCPYYGACANESIVRDNGSKNMPVDLVVQTETETGTETEAKTVTQTIPVMATAIERRQSTLLKMFQRREPVEYVIQKLKQK
jgi:hypothetical protein